MWEIKGSTQISSTFFSIRESRLCMSPNEGQEWGHRHFPPLQSGKGPKRSGKEGNSPVSSAAAFLGRSKSEFFSPLKRQVLTPPKNNHYSYQQNGWGIEKGSTVPSQNQIAGPERGGKSLGNSRERNNCLGIRLLLG